MPEFGNMPQQQPVGQGQVPPSSGPVPPQQGLVNLGSHPNGGSVTYAPPGVQAPIQHFNYSTPQATGPAKFTTPPQSQSNKQPVSEQTVNPIAKAQPGTTGPQPLAQMPYMEHPPGMSAPVLDHQISSPGPMSVGQLQQHIMNVNNQGLYQRGIPNK